MAAPKYPERTEKSIGTWDKVLNHLNHQDGKKTLKIKFGSWIVMATIYTDWPVVVDGGALPVLRLRRFAFK